MRPIDLDKRRLWPSDLRHSNKEALALLALLARKGWGQEGSEWVRVDTEGLSLDEDGFIEGDRHYTAEELLDHDDYPQQRIASIFAATVASTGSSMPFFKGKTGAAFRRVADGSSSLGRNQRWWARADRPAPARGVAHQIQILREDVSEEYDNRARSAAGMTTPAPTTRAGDASGKKKKRSAGDASFSHDDNRLKDAGTSKASLEAATMERLQELIRQAKVDFTNQVTTLRVEQEEIEALVREKADDLRAYEREAKERGISLSRREASSSRTPSKHEVTITKNMLTRMEKELAELRKNQHDINEAIESGKVNHTLACKYHLVLATLKVPHLGVEGLALILPDIIAGIFHTLSIELDSENVAKLCPSERSIRRWRDVVLQVQITRNNNKLYEAEARCIGSDGAKRHGKDITPTVSTHGSPEKEQVYVDVLDDDAAGKGAKKQAEAIVASIKACEIEGKGKLLLSGTTTDSASEMKAMMKYFIESPQTTSFFLMIFCCIHIHSLAFEKPWEKWFGASKMGVISAIQTR